MATMSSVGSRTVARYRCRTVERDPPGARRAARHDNGVGTASTGSKSPLAKRSRCCRQACRDSESEPPPLRAPRSPGWYAIGHHARLMRSVYVASAPIRRISPRSSISAKFVEAPDVDESRRLHLAEVHRDVDVGAACQGRDGAQSRMMRSASRSDRGWWSLSGVCGMRGHRPSRSGGPSGARRGLRRPRLPDRSSLARRFNGALDALYPVHRHRLPARPARIPRACAGPECRSGDDHSGRADAHCAPPCSTNAPGAGVRAVCLQWSVTDRPALGKRHEAGIDRAPVDKHRARAALPFAAPFLRTVRRQSRAARRGDASSDARRHRPVSRSA